MNLELLQKLTQTPGTSGYEDEIRGVIYQEVTPLADEIRIDPLGSLVAYRKGRGANNGHSKKMILAAHMDEIGVMVTHVEEKGYLRFTGIGGLRAIHHIGGRVRFPDGTLGVIYVEHRDDATQSPNLNHLYVDVGATKREEVPFGVGTPGVFVGPLFQQGNHLISKAMDDRIGCYLLIEVLRQLKNPPHDIFFVFTTQEEITLSGARTSAYRIDPDIAIAVDVTGTGDTPKSLPMDVKLGQGPAIKIKDGGMIAHPQVRDMLIAAAEKASIPYQLEILLGGTTDAMAMQLVRAGVPSGCLSIPCRYIHSPSEIVDIADVEQAIQVLLTAIT